MSRPRLLWVGDACVPTGFARVTHNVLMHFAQWWDVSVLGINYHGDPHEYPYDIYPASANDSDIYGLNRLPSLCRLVQPDVIVINNDPWVTPLYLKELRRHKIDIPVFAYLPVDGKNVRSAPLNGLACAIAYTDFGATELRDGGYNGRLATVPHGVDVDLYRPIPQWVARDKIGLHKNPNFTPGSFIVGVVNRNQPRKRMDLTIQLFSRWWHRIGKPKDVFLYFHCKVREDRGWNLEQLAKYYNVDSQLIVTARNMSTWVGIAESRMPWVYSAFDVQVTTTQGEGWGLTHQEGMACGIPQIVPVWSALGEWVTSGAYRVECDTHPVTPNDVNVVGGLPNEEMFINAMDRAWRFTDERLRLGRQARELVSDSQYRWPAIAYRFHRVFSEVLNGLPESVDAASTGQSQPTGATEGVSA